MWRTHGREGVGKGREYRRVTGSFTKERVAPHRHWQSQQVSLNPTKWHKSFIIPNRRPIAWPLLHPIFTTQHPWHSQTKNLAHMSPVSRRWQNPNVVVWARESSLKPEPECRVFFSLFVLFFALNQAFLNIVRNPSFFSSCATLFNSSVPSLRYLLANGSFFCCILSKETLRTLFSSFLFSSYIYIFLIFAFLWQSRARLAHTLWALLHSIVGSSSQSFMFTFFLYVTMVFTAKQCTTSFRLSFPFPSFIIWSLSWQYNGVVDIPSVWYDWVSHIVSKRDLQQDRRVQ